MVKTIEEMKQELEAEGYRLEILHGEYVFIAPNGLAIGAVLGLEDAQLPEYAEFKSIRFAYHHFQERKELEALRGLYQLNEELFSYAEMYMEHGVYPPKNRADDSETGISYGALRRIYSELLKIRNITSDESEA